MQRARAVHVQVFVPFLPLPPIQANKGHRRAGPKLAGHMYTTPICVLFFLHSTCGVQAARARAEKKLFERGPPVLGNIELSLAH